MLPDEKLIQPNFEKCERAVKRVNKNENATS